MPRAKLDEAALTRIADLHTRGTTERDIAKLLDVSKTTVHYALYGRDGSPRPPRPRREPIVRPAPTPPPVVVPAPVEVVPVAVEAPAPIEPLAPLTDADVIDAMRRAVAEATAHATAARQVGDVRAAALWGRLLSQTASELRKYVSDQEPGDPDDALGARGDDVRAAAALARAKLIAGLERVREQREAWPRCAHCGQRVRPS